MIKVATDAGGTFTDLVAFEETSGKIYVGKALTTPKDPSQGVIHSIAQSREAGLATNDISFFVHGGTTVINAVTERKGVRTALVTTEGFRDVIAIGRGNRPDLYNLHSTPREPFVPRHLRLEVTERIDAKGKVRVPLSMASVDVVADAIASTDVEAVAIVFLHAYINPAHEMAAAERLRAMLPGVAVTASHEISRQWREYERSNTAVLSAYVQPVMARYLANLSDALADQQIDCRYYCMQSNGGLAEFEAAERAPLVLVESGPAGRRGGRRADRRSHRRDGNPLSRRWRHNGEVFADPQRPAGTAAGLQARMEPHQSGLSAASTGRRYRGNRRRRRIDRARRREWRPRGRSAKCRLRSGAGLLQPRRQGSDGY
jgi:N-methylhydantoinase A